MRKPRTVFTLPKLRTAKASLFDFCDFFFLYYLKRKVMSLSRSFEKNKNKIVRFFLMKRGRYNRPFLHLTTMGVLGVGVLIAPYLADTYPIFVSQASTDLSLAENNKQSIIVGEDVFETQISDKPRDKVISYTVQKGDTLSTVANKFRVSTDTIKWENDLTSDAIAVGDTLKILPVSGIAHKVSGGDTVYTIAKKYDTEAQKIVDYPFNEFANPETFSLVEGQIVVVPDGVQPQAQPVYQQRRQTYIAQGPVTTSASGFTWPLRGGISQFASWYHMALDITSSIGTPIVASHNGRVGSVSVGGWNGGYGTEVYIDSSDGSQSHYAHMSSVNVSPGQNVVGGQTIVGWVGMTGRTTGPHLHFEIRRGGVLVNPMSYLQ